MSTQRDDRSDRYDDYDIAVLYRHANSPLSKAKFNPLTITRCLAQSGFMLELHFFPMRDHRLKRTNRMLAVGPRDTINALLKVELVRDYFQIEPYRWDSYRPPLNVNGIQLHSTHWRTKEHAGQMAYRIVQKLFRALPGLRYRYRVFIGERGSANQRYPAGEPLYYKIVIFMDNYPAKIYRLVLEIARTFPFKDYKVVYSINMQSRTRS